MTFKGSDLIMCNHIKLLFFNLKSKQVRNLNVHLCHVQFLLKASCLELVI